MDGRSDYKSECDKEGPQNVALPLYWDNTAMRCVVWGHGLVSDICVISAVTHRHSAPAPLLHFHSLPSSLRQPARILPMAGNNDLF